MITIAKLKCPGCGNKIAVQIDTAKVGQTINGSCPQCKHPIKVNITEKLVHDLERLSSQNQKKAKPAASTPNTETYVPVQSKPATKSSSFSNNANVSKDMTFVPTKNTSPSFTSLVLSHRDSAETPYQRFTINQQYTVIGRKNNSGQMNQPDVEVNTQDKYMSKKHCLVRRQDNGQYSIEDYKSANGTKLNGKKLESGEAIYLMSGDVITIGHTDFTVSLETE